MFRIALTEEEKQNFSMFMSENIEKFNGFDVPKDFNGVCIICAGTTGAMKVWIQQGVFHREDGPALIRLNGAFSYYYEGKNFSEQDYYKIPKVMMNVMNQIVNEP